MPYMQNSDVTANLVHRAADLRRRRETGRSRIVGLVWLAVAAVVGAFLAFIWGPDRQNSTAAPQCDGQVMARGDRCVITSHGSSNTYSYDQMVHNGHSDGQFTMILGYVVLALAVALVVPVFLRLDPAKPWGTPIPTPCPQCGRNGLQEKKIALRHKKGRTTYNWTALVTVCTGGCDFSHVRKP
ncbi:hypothetical protein [Nocardia stercoris]|uniref:Uncharacterized protein n=1 Tax=Nocardia stercoris TaxID=2483361 RepID=A0A3M2KZ25_9NOCA|nr:hypothetical protein [Nocardia stercoris]RMI29886.1 hypothetical protein EBN03_24135 [Nocardia stercoris]